MNKSHRKNWSIKMFWFYQNGKHSKTYKPVETTNLLISTIHMYRSLSLIILEIDNTRLRVIQLSDGYDICSWQFWTGLGTKI